MHYWSRKPRFASLESPNPHQTLIALNLCCGLLVKTPPSWHMRMLLVSQARPTASKDLACKTRVLLSRQLSLLQAYERRFPVCPLVPQLLATDVLWEEKSDDSAHHTVERRCTIDFEVPYILRKVLILG